MDETQDNLPPPSGDSKKAERYIKSLIQLINADKLEVNHTDLSQFDPTNLQDHYRLDLKDYQVEVSHSKQPDSGKDFYVLLFNNIKQVRENCSERVILAYMHLDGDQFIAFKRSCEGQVGRAKQREEEKRLEEALSPIDAALQDIESPSKDDLDKAALTTEDSEEKEHAYP